MALPVNVPVQQNQQINVQNPPQSQQNAPIVELDPVSKVKQLLMPRLKESLTALMKVAAQILGQNSQADDGHKSQEGLQQMYEKSLEDFYSICDQIEVNLRLALEMQCQQIDSGRYTPLPVTVPKSDANLSDHQSVPYPQFLVTVKHQISCTKDMFDSLNEFTKKLEEKQLMHLALEMQCQQIDSGRYTPLPVTVPKSDANLSDHQSVPYPQFLVTVKHQISCTKDMFDSLNEFIKKPGEKQKMARLALEMQCQQIDSGRYTPLPVTVPKSDANLSDHQSVPYPQFLVTVKHQISCTKDMFDSLNEFIKKLGEKQ